MADFVKNPCERCGHSPDDHRLDDALNVGPGDPGARYRCLQGLGEGEGPVRLCEQGCPDFVGEPITWLAKEEAANVQR